MSDREFYKKIKNLKKELSKEIDLMMKSIDGKKHCDRIREISNQIFKMDNERKMRLIKQEIERRKRKRGE